MITPPPQVTSVSRKGRFLEGGGQDFIVSYRSSLMTGSLGITKIIACSKSMLNMFSMAIIGYYIDIS